MRILALASALFVWAFSAEAAKAVEIRGQYLEARTCDVYTGPCFANGEMGMAGKEAVLAWRVDEGRWHGAELTGLSVALVLKAENTLGEDGVFPAQPGHIRSVLLVDDKANTVQRDALIQLVKDSVPIAYTSSIQRIETAVMSLAHQRDSDHAVFQAGTLAEIRTRGLDGNDCVCTNETVFYQPLADVAHPRPVYSVKQAYEGDGLNSRWSLNGSRSSFLATFRK